MRTAERGTNQRYLQLLIIRGMSLTHFAKRFAPTGESASIGLIPPAVSSGSSDMCTVMPPLYRSWNDTVVVSTTPHYVAMFVSLRHTTEWTYLLYAAVIGVSSTLSVIWHILHERQNYVCVSDYLFAFIWTAMDIIMAVLYSEWRFVAVVVVLNGVVFITNHGSDYIVRHKLLSYRTAHSIWHILSSCKAIGVSYILTM